MEEPIGAQHSDELEQSQQVTGGLSGISAIEADLAS